MDRLATHIKAAISEGIESQDIWDKLKELNCDLVRGYLIYEPTPIDACREWITRNSADKPASSP